MWNRADEQRSTVRRQSNQPGLCVDRRILVAAVLVGRRQAEKRIEDVVNEGRLLLLDGAVKTGKPVHEGFGHDKRHGGPSGQTVRRQREPDLAAGALEILVRDERHGHVAASGIIAAVAAQIEQDFPPWNH